METAWPLLIFFAGLFGIGLLILVCGIQSRELEEADSSSAAQRPSLWFSTSRFFEPTVPIETSARAEAEAASQVLSMEAHLREQTLLADLFVDEPSVERLHGPPTQEGGSGEGLLERVEQFLRTEQTLVLEFLSNPSVDRLHFMPTAA